MAKQKAPKVLTFDIETSPYEVRVWRTGEQFVDHGWIQKERAVIAWAGKWLGKPGVTYMDQRNAADIRDDRKLVEKLVKMLDEADVVITKNGKRFDVKVLNGRIAKHQIKQPSPFRHIDTEKMVRKHFDLASYSLEYVAKEFNLKHKKSAHKKFPGRSLWDACMAGDRAAWKEMEAYNKADVLTTEDLYEYIKEWGGSGVDMGAFFGERHCRECGSNELQSRGPVPGTKGKKHRFLCKDCGAWNTLKAAA